MEFCKIFNNFQNYYLKVKMEILHKNRTLQKIFVQLAMSPRHLTNDETLTEKF